jgi:hypothetical protein
MLLVMAVVLAAAAGCNRASNLTKEVAYVNAPQMFLRDRLAPIFEKKGIVTLGEKVYVLEHKPRFSRVRNERGEEGWIADRYLVPAATYDQFEKLATDNANRPIQAHGTARTLLNLHLTPGRDTEHLFQLKEGDKLDILARDVAEKPASQQPAPKLKETAAGKTAKKEEPTGPAMEDWYLVRGGDKGRVGWVLARMVDIDIPLEIAEYAEGQRIVSDIVLSQVQDGDKKVPQYLVMLTDNKDGLPWDYNQIRVFTWNTKRHRYETAYREHNLVGVFPVSTGTADFGKEGMLPTFTLRVKDDQGKVTERQYRMIGPIVRRVATPEELHKEATEKAERKAAAHKHK